MKTKTSLNPKQSAELILVTPTQVPAILLLPENDPTVALYEGIELYETNQHQQALGKLVYAAQHFHLHAIPYLEELTKPKEKPLVIDTETQEKLTAIKTWAVWFKRSEILPRQFFSVSQSVIELRKLKAKDAVTTPATGKGKKAKVKTKPKSKYEKKRAEFLKEDTDCAHLHYHQALLAQSEASLSYAADRGHLLGLAYFVHCGKIPNPKNHFSTQLCQLDFHRSQANVSFASRLFITSINPQEFNFKAYFHYESVRLGVPQAISVIARLYFDKKEQIETALPLLAIAVLQREPRAHCHFSEVIIKRKSIELPGFDTSPLSVIRLLRRNLAHDYQTYDYPGNSQSDIEAEIRSHSIFRLADITSTLLDQKVITDDTDYLTYLEDLFRQEKDLTQNHTKELGNCIGSYYIHLSLQQKNSQEKLRLHNIALEYLRSTHSDESNLSRLLNLLKITHENYKLRQSLNNLDPAPKRDLLTYLKFLIEKIEPLLTDCQANDPNHNQQHYDFVIICIAVFLGLIYLSRKNAPLYFEKYRKYLLLGVQHNEPLYLQYLSQHYVFGDCGFEQDTQKARHIIHALPAEYRNTEQSIRSLAFSYFRDTPPDSQQALSLLVQNAPQHPELYYDLGEFYSDGHIGVEVDQARAQHYYELAVLNKITEGNIGLATYKLEEYRHCQDAQQRLTLQRDALRLLHTAHEEGASDAPFFLGKIYLLSMLGMERNLTLAREYFEEAIKRNDHAYSHAYLEMMDAGYEGEDHVSMDLELIKLDSLKATGYIKENPDTMLEYGIVHLEHNPITGIHYICKSAYYNNSDAKYLLAVLQSLQGKNLITLAPFIMNKINKVDYRPLMQIDPGQNAQLPIQRLHQFAKLVMHYIELGYNISPEFVIEIIQEKFFTRSFDLNDIESSIKDQFAPEDVVKVRLLAELVLENEESGDIECQKETDRLLGIEENTQLKVQRKISKLDQESKISMHTFGTCLKAFLSAGVTLTGEDKKAVTAAAKVHRPHLGRGKRNPHQDLEGGRKTTVRFAFDAMQRNLPTEALAPNSNTDSIKPK